MVLTRAALNEYDSRIERLGNAAYDLVSKRVSRYIERFPEASVAEVRDFTIQSVSYAVSVYGDAASTCAADLYDQMAEASGMALQPAVIDTSDVSGYIEQEIRYQARRLAEGEAAEFVNAAANKARSQTKRRANSTMQKNVKRDGIRYARVPMGGDTCTFCIMLASRGFVYLSAKTAGEGTHYHDNCRCKVVPQFDKKGRETKVEGYDPVELYARWKKYEEIDATAGVSQAAKQRMKEMLGANPSMSVEEVENKWVEQAKAYTADLKKVNSSAYKRAVSDIVGDDMADSVWKDMRHTLKVKSGTPFESLYAYDLTDGIRIGAVTDSKDELKVVMTDVIREAVTAAANDGHSVALMHNHPGSSLPSAADVISLASTGATTGIIACHDGSVIKFSAPAKLADYNDEEKEAFSDLYQGGINRRTSAGKSEKSIIEDIAAKWGVEVERIRIDQ